MNLFPGAASTQPLAFGRGPGHPAVHSKGALHHNPREPASLNLCKSPYHRLAGRFFDALHHINPCIKKQRFGFAPMSRIWIGSAYNDPLDPGPDKCSCTWPGPSMSRTGLKSDIHRRASCSTFPEAPHGIIQRFHLCVRLSCSLVPACAQFYAIFHQNSADRRIWACLPCTAPRQRERPAHIFTVVHN